MTGSRVDSPPRAAPTRPWLRAAHPAAAPPLPDPGPQPWPAPGFPPSSEHAVVTCRCGKVGSLSGAPGKKRRKRKSPSEQRRRGGVRRGRIVGTLPVPCRGETLDVGGSQAPGRPPSRSLLSGSRRPGTVGASVATRRPDAALRVPLAQSLCRAVPVRTAMAWCPRRGRPQRRLRETPRQPAVSHPGNVTLRVTCVPFPRDHAFPQGKNRASLPLPVPGWCLLHHRI